MVVGLRGTTKDWETGVNNLRLGVGMRRFGIENLSFRHTGPFFKLQVSFFKLPPCPVLNYVSQPGRWIARYSPSFKLSRDPPQSVGSLPHAPDGHAGFEQRISERISRKREVALQIVGNAFDLPFE